MPTDSEKLQAIRDLLQRHHDWLVEGEEEHRRSDRKRLGTLLPPDELLPPADPVEWHAAYPISAAELWLILEPDAEIPIVASEPSRAGTCQRCCPETNEAGRRLMAENKRRAKEYNHAHKQWLRTLKHKRIHEQEVRDV